MNIATVRTELQLRLVVAGRPPLPVAAELGYAAADPWAVHLVFRAEGRSQPLPPWVFARQLLTEGLAAPVGDGDVRVWPTVGDEAPVVWVQLVSPAGSAVVEVDRDALAVFLQQTYLAVPTGTEDELVNLDAGLALMLGG